MRWSASWAADSVHVSKATAARALAVLEERGFVVPMTKGAFSLKLRHATTWRLTEFNCDVTHDLPTKDFARWSPQTQNTVSSQATTVSRVRLNGISGETVNTENRPAGTSGETVEPISPAPRSHHRDTYSLPGTGGKRARHQSAVASAPPPLIASLMQARACDRAEAEAIFASIPVMTTRLDFTRGTQEAKMTKLLRKAEQDEIDATDAGPSKSAASC